MKKRYMVAVAALAIPLGLTAWPIDDPFEKRVFGPFRCDACRVEAPIADAGTLAYIRHDNENRHRKKANRVRRGEKYIVCNASTCTVYEYTSTGGWLGIKQDSITPTPFAGGPVGARPGRGGSPIIGSGGGPVGSGTVTVGPISNPAKQQEN